MSEEKKQRLKEYQKECHKNYHNVKKKRYSKEKASEYYAQNKQAIKKVKRALLQLTTRRKSQN